MERYFVDIIDDEIIISEKQIHQIIKVMRNNVGDKITLVNEGYFYLCEITSISPFKFKIIDKSLADTELKKDITLLYCLPKGDKLEFAVQKATELGVKKIVLVSSSRTIMKIKKEDEARKLERFRKIALEASEQCSRAFVPQIVGVISIKDIGKYKSSLNLIAYENERALNISESLLKDHDSISILIGAEGGFSLSEVESANELGFQSVCLGNRILRSETAVCYALSLLSHYSEE